MGSDSGGNVETTGALTGKAENIGSEAYAQKREEMELKFLLEIYEAGRFV